MSGHPKLAWHSLMAAQAVMARKALFALLAFKDESVDLFQQDRASVLLSFVALLIVLPFVMLGQAAQVVTLYAVDPDAPIVALLVNRLIAQVIAVAVFSLITRQFLGLYHKGDRWYWFTTASNWLRVFRMVIFVPMLFLAMNVPALLIFLPLFKLYTLTVEGFLINRQLGFTLLETCLLLLLEIVSVFGAQSLGDFLAMLGR